MMSSCKALEPKNSQTFQVMHWIARMANHMQMARSNLLSPNLYLYLLRPWLHRKRFRQNQKATKRQLISGNKHQRVRSKM
mmetsp:Transcript_13150/g.40468  ORF Transcript_13150/g.40468 Transcript_13150/m.40468 type:complete len:80 (-) Transcript_13150:782-1021(-)